MSSRYENPGVSVLTPQPADAVFEGGGVKGIGLVGAIAAFEEAGWRWENVAGTSGGAIVAALLAAGYTAAEVRHVMEREVDFARLMDPSPLGRVPVVGKYLSLLFQRGLYKGDYFYRLMRDLLLAKKKETFSDLELPRLLDEDEQEWQDKYRFKLRLVASDITGGRMLHLPQDIALFGHDPATLDIALAVRMSMSIPFFFRPVDVHAEPGRRKHRIMDGGILSNFPVHLFDSKLGVTPKWPTIGFLLWEPGSDAPREHRTRWPWETLIAMFNTMAQAHDRKALVARDEVRVVKVPTGRYRTTDFTLTPADKQWLYDSGYQAAAAFVKTFSMDAYRQQRSVLPPG